MVRLVGFEPIYLSVMSGLLLPIKLEALYLLHGLLLPVTLIELLRIQVASLGYFSVPNQVHY